MLTGISRCVSSVVRGPTRSCGSTTLAEAFEDGGLFVEADSVRWERNFLRNERSYLLRETCNWRSS
jgi:hypothetical protein